MPVVKINDKEVEVPAGTNMIEAAKLVGEDIPHYCYHPHLSIAGNCRMCLVDVVGGRGPDIACNMTARDGLAIRTDTPIVKKMRKSVMEFLLVNHPLDCPICDQSGECKLQDYYMDHGQYDSRGLDPKVGKHKRQDIGTQLVLDSERCVHCSRCVRFGDEVTETGELRLMNRTDHTEIGIFPGERITHEYQGNLSEICPVGALTSKDFRFERRVWYLKETSSVCTGCATGCNIRVCHQEGELFRFLSRRNDQVNKSWLCDTGRFSHSEVASLARLLKARLGCASATIDAALADVVARVRAAGATKVGVVLGTRATNEANWALLQLARTTLKGSKVFVVEGNDHGPAKGDAILQDADRNANTAGAQLLAAHDGDVGDADALRAALPQLAVLIVLEDDVLARLGGAGGPAVVFLGALKNTTSEAAAVVLPTAHAVEQDGSFVNRQGRVQRIRRAVNPAGDSAPAYVMLDKLAASLGGNLGTQMVAGTFNAMARAVTRMKGLEFKGLGEGGVLLAPVPAPVAANDNAQGATP
jgi:NADH-quinone oxidoreductase subunit G